MTGLLEALPCPAYVSECAPAAAATRKYRRTLEAVRPSATEPVVGVHSAAANRVVAALLEAGALESAFAPWRLTEGGVKREVRAYGKGSTSRADFVLATDAGDAVVEVKSVTLAGGALTAGAAAHAPVRAPPADADPAAPRLALFPDTVSARAAKHAADLAAVARAGGRAAAVFLVQRGDCAALAPAAACDPAYAAALADAAGAGVRLIGLRGDVREAGGRLFFDYRGVADVVLPPAGLLAGAPPAKKARKGSK
jgi:sugar fermentation stimulation protein A